VSATKSTDGRPVDAVTGEPIGPLAQPGYYPGFSTLSQQNFWDAKTRSVILDRVNNVPPIRFFTAEQAQLLTAICDLVLPQDDRDAAHTIPIVPRIDERLYHDVSDGYRYEGMPPDREAYALGLQAIDEMARLQHGCGFLDLDPRRRGELLQSLHDGKPAGGHDIWKRMPVHRFWMLLAADCAEAYYSHPWAWDEIGFGGPAYPRAYMRLERGEPETWEVEETRYEWNPPGSAVSAEYDAVGGQAEHFASPGQGGTH
jgi:hypothetical protein